MMSHTVEGPLTAPLTDRRHVHRRCDQPRLPIGRATVWLIQRPLHIALGRMRRAGVVGAITVTAVSLGAAPALAGPPPSTDLAGNTITCGGEVLTFTEGVQSGDLRRVQLGNGGQVVVVDVQLHQAVLVDADGRTYRAVGGANSTALVQQQDDLESLAGHFNVTIVVLGERGQFGTVMWRERTDRDGSVTTIDAGSCVL